MLLRRRFEVDPVIARLRADTLTDAHSASCLFAIIDSGNVENLFCDN